MRTVFIGLAAAALTIIPGPEAARADDPTARTATSFEPRANHNDRRNTGLLARLFPPPRQISNGCTINWGGGLSEGRFMVRRVTSC